MITGNPIWESTRTPDRAITRVELTDLIRFKDHWYCGFCEGEIHSNHPTGRGWLIRSANGIKWEAAKVFDWDAADVRDPMLSVTPEGKLMVNTSLAFVSREGRYWDPESGAELDYIPQEAEAEKKFPKRYYQLDNPGTPDSCEEHMVARQSVTWLSDDGLNWGSANCCPSGVNTWRWQVRWHNGMAYSVGYCGKDTRGTLYRSRDGKSWRPLLENFFPDGKGTEATLAFGPDGTGYCLLRYDKKETFFGVGKAPYYQEWNWQKINVDCGPEHGGTKPASEVFTVHFGGPKMICTVDGRLFAVARMLWPWRDDGKITLFEIDPATATLKIVEEIDGTSYAGLVEHEGELWISYGSRGANTLFLTRMKLPN